ncbi:MAG: hypothetical protein WBD07_00835 [Vicinamibacterales bacterium]
MLDAGLHLFETVGFLPDRVNLANRDMPTLQEADGLLAARLAVRTGALGLGMIRIRLDHITVGLDTRRLSVATVTSRADAKPLP